MARDYKKLYISENNEKLLTSYQIQCKSVDKIIIFLKDQRKKKPHRNLILWVISFKDSGKTKTF